MTIEEIRELIRLVSETGVAELEVQRGENRVRIKQASGGETSVILPSPGMVPAFPATPVAPAGSARPETPLASPADSLVYTKSPIVGTFYESASPGNPPFVKVGDHVTPGKVLCIIESMKLMNEIEADTTGVIESVLVANGKAVEYGEALFGIRPV